jgi:hypothetical protein
VKTQIKSQIKTQINPYDKASSDLFLAGGTLSLRKKILVREW